MPTETGTQSIATSQSLCMPFPIRPKFIAQVIIPRDMTAREAERLCTFVKSLAQPKEIPNAN